MLCLMECYGKLFEEVKYMTTNRSECMKKCNICGQWVITEYKPNYPILNDSYFRHPKENFICQECAKKREEKNTFLRGEIDD